MKTREVVTQAVSDLKELLQQIEGDDDADLGDYTTIFDQISQRADEAANLLSNANQALQGEQEANGEDEADPEADGEALNDEELEADGETVEDEGEPEEEPQKVKSKLAKKK